MMGDTRFESFWSEASRTCPYEIMTPDTTVNTRQKILHAAEQCVNGARQGTYGSPEDNFKTIAAYWDNYLVSAHIATTTKKLRPEDVAAMMMLLKIARMTGGTGSIDNWIDIAGYAACGGELAETAHTD